MPRIFPIVGAMALAIASAAVAQPAPAPNDAQIAHIAYTADVIDVAAAKQALAKSQNPAVRAFAEEMVRDHTAVNDRAIALVTRLKVTPQPNATSTSLTEAADAKRAELDKLTGAAFDRAYVQNEVAYHRTVNGALGGTLIPNARNPELKALLQTGLKLFQEHETHAEHLAAQLG
jgi:putative membrane protein